MIRQHYLQQQRLQSNHDRLLERYQNILTPKISEFRTFGTSSLPGRKYEEHLNTMSSNPNRKDSLVALSRAGIGSSGDTYRWLGNGATESLPKNINTVMQHSREQPMPLVHAEKFEPVQIYEHPLFGPTPAYVRPVFNQSTFLNETRDNDSDKESSADDDDDEDNDVRSQVSNVDHNNDRMSSSASIKNHDNDGDAEDDDDDDNGAPRGYISYKKWKKKIENLIPVNPLLFHIYTQRPNGSINSYGQSLYSSLIRPKLHRPSSRDEDVSTPTISDVASLASEIPQTSSASSQRYNKLQAPTFSRAGTTRSLPPIPAGNDSESSEDELSPPDSPVPYLSRNKPTPFFSSTPATSTIMPSIPKIETTSLSPAATTTITPATLNTTSTNIPDTLSPPASSLNTSNIPPAPPIPPSLSAASTHSYQTPSSFSLSSPPIVPSVPKPSSNSSSTATYQVPSTSSMADTTTALNQPKAVTFGGSSSFPGGDDISSSSDSDDDEKQKRRRRKKRQAEAGIGGNVDSSSSDD